jgi:hypothetical protein
MRDIFKDIPPGYIEENPTTDCGSGSCSRTYRRNPKTDQMVLINQVHFNSCARIKALKKIIAKKRNKK